MKIQFNVPLIAFGEVQKDEKGEPIMLGVTLANFLGISSHNQTGMNFVDVMEWATKIHKGEEVDLTSPQQELFKTFIEKAEMTAFVKSCLIGAMKPVKEEEKKKK